MVHQPLLPGFMQQTPRLSGLVDSGRTLQEAGRGDGGGKGDQLWSEDGQQQQQAPILTRLLGVLQCFPPNMHDDSLPMPHPTDENVTPCIKLGSNLTSEQPMAIVAMHALLLLDPCQAAQLPSYQSAQLAAVLARAQQLQPAPCDGSDGSSSLVYAHTVLSDRIVDAFVGFIATAPHAGAGHAVLSHVLRHPTAYRYPTILEHALQAVLFVHNPSNALLLALQALVSGLDGMEKQELAAFTAAAMANDTEAASALVSVMLHENYLKSSAVMTLAALVSRGRIAAVDTGSVSMEEVVSAPACMFCL